MSNYQIQKRPKFEENQDTLKLGKLNDKYNVIHPSQVSLAADLLLIQKHVGGKDTVIPVHRNYIMKSIPYFAKQYNENGIWREGKLKDQEEYHVSNLPETVSVTSVVAYIKNLYEDDYNPFSVENCLDILELADYWCDEFMKTECLNFIEAAMNDDLFSRIFENSRIHNSVGRIVNEFVRRERSLKCEVCENNRYHVFLPKESPTVVLTKSNRAIHFKSEPVEINDWDVFTTKMINTNTINHDVSLKFMVTQFLFSNVFVGIVNDNLDAVSLTDLTSLPEGYEFWGFRMQKYKSDVTKETKEKHKTLLVACHYKNNLSHAKQSILVDNDTKPFDRFVNDDVFTLVFTKTLLKLRNDRGFECEIKMNHTSPRLNLKFAVQIGHSEFNEGKGLELLPNFDHICNV